MTSVAVEPASNEGIRFEVDRDRCAGCGACARDCLARIIRSVDGVPTVVPEREAECYRCLHCLAICPTGAISLLGERPSGRSLKDARPDAAAVETLLLGRRSIRRYRDEDVDPALTDHLLEIAATAPSAHNDHAVQFTLVEGRERMARLRERVLSGVERAAAAGTLPPQASVFIAIARHWREAREDILFRGAPNLLVATAPRDSMLPLHDCLIALAAFEIAANANGLGTLWNGLAQMLIDGPTPELREELNLPEGHVSGFAMCFGRPDVRYARAITRRPAAVRRVG